MKSSSIFSIAVIILALQFFVTSCRMPSIELSPEENDIVDTLFNSQLPDLRAELDSLCKLNEAQWIKTKTDSLIELQLTEIRKLVKRQ